MSSLEDKILGNKSENYCSSSEDENEEPCQKNQTGGQPLKWQGQSSNTGPKGVINDWENFKKAESEARQIQIKENLKLIKKMSLTAENKTNNHTEEDNRNSDRSDDNFLEKYRKKRMQEMLSAINSDKPIFGSLIDLPTSSDFLDAIDNENKTVTVIIHIYEQHISACKKMNNCLHLLASTYPEIKFCKMISSSAGMSFQFKSCGIPALLIYKGGQMLGNFIRVTDELGHDFYEGDVENFLIEHGMIIERTYMSLTCDSSKTESKIE